LLFLQTEKYGTDPKMGDYAAILRNTISSYLDASPDWEELKPNGKGIVTGAYDREFPSTYVLLKELKRLDIGLPVEVFYKQNELSPIQVALLNSVDPKFKLRLLSDPVSGFATKPFNIFRSSFNEVLWLDADNYPIRNPEYLFLDQEYVAKGSLFWRDICHDLVKDGAWQAFDVPKNDSEEFESGQLLINKQRCWVELLVTLFYNQNSAYFYQYLDGDKNTFRFAWQWVHHRLKGAIYYNRFYHARSNELVPYGFMPYGPVSLGEPNEFGVAGGATVLQHRDREGEPIFNHRNLCKLRLDFPNSVQRHVLNENFYHDHIAELKALLSA